jgi:hypothetical protein
MTPNKIPQEIEEKILKDIKERILYGFYYGTYVFNDVQDALKEAIQLSYEAGQKQEREDVLKLIDDWALSSILSFDDDSIKQKKIIDDITKYIKELKSKLAGSKDD